MSPWRHRLTSIAVAAFAMASCSGETPTTARLPVDEVLSAVPADVRRYEVRITGLRWAPLRAAAKRRSNEELQFEGVAGEILRRSERSPSAVTLHAAGVANVLLGRAHDGVLHLERASSMASGDGRVWNDLAAARFVYASGDPARLPSALAAADHALRLSPSLAEAHFNRALILRRLGIRNEAKSAFRTALTLDSDPAWAAEIRRELADLNSPPLRALSDVIEPLLAVARAGDPTPLQRVVRERLDDAQTTSEVILAMQWAKAVVDGERERSERLLSDVRAIAKAVAAVNGDRLLVDVVGHIDSAPHLRHAIAKAYLAYRDVRLRYRDQRAGCDAEFVRAAALLARVGSPMEHVARFLAGAATFDVRHVEQSTEMLEQVLRDIRGRGYQSLAAGVESQLGKCYGFRGLWTASLLHFDRAQRTYAALGEKRNAAFAEGMMSAAYDRIGQVERGWRHRVSALRVLSPANSDERSLALIVDAAHAETVRGDFESALSLLTLARRQVIAAGNPLRTAETMLREARVLRLARSNKSAREALEATKRIAAEIGDRLGRHRIEADMRMVEGEIVRSSDPRRAVEVITVAIDFYAANDFPILLPGAYLERGRAYLAVGERAKALEDFTRGLAEIERERANVQVDVRSTIFDTVPDLIAETVDLLLENGDDAEAYAVVERARARTLVEALDVPRNAAGEVGIEAIAASLPPNALVVEYALLPHSLVAFCIRSDGMRVVRVPVDRVELRRRVDELGLAIDARKPVGQVRHLASTLYDHLVAPLASRLEGIDTVYIVPDRFLYATPFAALFDARRGEYLIEQYRVVIAPSGAFMLRRARTRREREPALIVSDPSASSGNWLPAARREAAAIARFYSHSTLIGGADATIHRFVEIARRSSLIHYAGHAGVDDAAGGFLPLAASDRDDGRLDAAAISRLPLSRASLIILSACATMRGSETRVEGMPSISRAFLTAGAQSVLGMLWEIDDEDAARFLLSFHEHLASEGTPAAALQATQRHFLRHERQNLRHPASWAFAELLGVD